ncbi:tyrosine-protein kinase fyna-like [Cydia amplana]|uniref:tyrosine-protein kinase fyna-like n=1 Tax=Cydia amplana TaxID=1869771 RepID=UPI002FE514F4
MEHAFYGDLRRYLRARRTLAERARDGLPEPEAAHVAAAALTRLAREAAAALGYLAHERLVHRDVRAANCLVDVRRSLKLADFGMARRLDKPGKREYLCKRRAMFPVLWMAPESLSRGVFSAASDVWALGVLLLELATLGERPYGAWATPRVLRHVREGGAPPLPQDATPSTRGITAACWRRLPEERPTAAELVAYLADHPRAIQPALEPNADADTNAAPDTDVYIEEWTVN